MSLVENNIEEIKISASQKIADAESLFTIEEKRLIKVKFKLKNFEGSEKKYLYLPTFEIVADSKLRKIAEKLNKTGIGNYTKINGCTIYPIPSYFITYVQKA